MCKIKDIISRGIILLIQNIQKCFTEIYELKTSLRKDISILFNNGSKYDYHFAIRNVVTQYKILKDHLVFQGKYCKIHKLFSFNRKRSYKK